MVFNDLKSYQQTLIWLIFYLFFLLILTNIHNKADLHPSETKKVYLCKK